MEKLKFVIDIQFTVLKNPYPLNEDALNKFKVKITNHYGKYLKEIKECNGYYRITSVTDDGLKFYGNIVATEALLDVLNDAKFPNP